MGDLQCDLIGVDVCMDWRRATEAPRVVCYLAVKSYVLNRVPAVAGVYPEWHDT